MRREELGWSKHKLVMVAGISGSHLALIESGQRGVRPERAARLAAALSIPVSEWVTSYLESESRPATILVLSQWLHEQDYLDCAHRVLARIWILDHHGYHNRYLLPTMHQAAQLAFKQERWPIAKRWLARILKNPRHMERKNLGRFHYDYGLTLLMLKQPIEAYATFQVALTYWPMSDHTVKTWVGFAHIAMGNIMLEHRAYRKGSEHYRLAARFVNEPWQSEARFGKILCDWQDSGMRDSVALQQFGSGQPLSSHLRSRWILAMAIAARQAQNYSVAEHWLQTLCQASQTLDLWQAKLWAEWATLLAIQQRWDELPPVLEYFNPVAHLADPRDRLVIALLHAYLFQQPVDHEDIRSAIVEDYEERLPFMLGTLFNVVAPPPSSG